MFPFVPDNASDPGVCAKQMWIDVLEEKGQFCLTFTDNGCSMTSNKLHKMLKWDICLNMDTSCSTAV